MVGFISFVVIVAALKNWGRVRSGERVVPIATDKHAADSPCDWETLRMQTSIGKARHIC